MHYVKTCEIVKILTIEEQAIGRRSRADEEAVPLGIDADLRKSIEAVADPHSLRLNALRRQRAPHDRTGNIIAGDAEIGCLSPCALCEHRDIQSVAARKHELEFEIPVDDIVADPTDPRRHISTRPCTCNDAHRESVP
jgi:hypothetical protein